uniref:Secreted protein n=1 Tax=Haemonchus contortus TaxID=6289 RepID=A0A7I5E701_HAECO
MRCIFYVALISLLSVAGAISTTSLEILSDAVDTNVISPLLPLTKEARRERRKERRILRKKKQRLRELREEIRILTLSLQQPNTTAVFDKTEVKLKQKSRQGRKGIKWRKSLLEKLKGIVKRLDRMERRLVEGNQIVSSEVVLPSSNSSSASTTSTPMTTTTTTVATSINLPINETVIQKLKRIQPAISRSRSGENGTACSAHKDCRPGHCCHRLITDKHDTKSTCVLHRLEEGKECLDGCQCSTQLNCFLPDTKFSRNSTKAFCKKAASSDILTGSYLYQKDSIIVDSGST